MPSRSLTRRAILQTLAAAPAFSAAKKPNILFIAVDDLNTRLGCYGAAEVKSPNVDGLASRSVRFDKAYCQYPLCNPSRASLLSGRRPPLTHVTDNNTWIRDAMPDVVTLPQHFRNNGYTTAKIGKIFHVGLDDPRAWTMGGETKHGSTGPVDPDTRAEREKRADRWVAVPGDGEDQPDFRTATVAIDYLNKLKEGPFFLGVGFVKPHVPFIAPKKYFDLYNPDRMELPPDFAPKVTGTTPSYRPNFDLFIRRESPPPLAREAIAAYYAAISFMDSQLGRVLAELDRLQLRDNTIIVLFGDHGWHLGEKGMWSKLSLFEVSVRAPLLISAPGMSGNGAASPRTVEFVDIYPTLSDLAGLPAPSGLAGRSLRPLLDQPKSPWDKPAYTFIKRGKIMGASVCDERYRYTEWDQGRAGAELYDHQADPAEIHNLAADAEQSTRVKAMQQLLAQG